MFEFDMVKVVILLLMWPFIKFDCSRYQCSSERLFFNLKIYGKLAGLSNKFEPSMVFDPSEFEGPRFDLYICKMIISILSWFFHTIFKDLTEQNAPFCVLLKNNFLGGVANLDPLPLLVSRGLACMLYFLLKFQGMFKILQWNAMLWKAPTLK